MGAALPDPPPPYAPLLARIHLSAAMLNVSAVQLPFATFFFFTRSNVATNDETSVSEKIKENPHGFFLSPLFFAISRMNFQKSIAEI